MLHTLPKVIRRKKRLGRGIGSRGAKSGRGMKGQRSRAGSRIRAGFEGGQTPLYLRLPKARGSKRKSSASRTRTTEVTLKNLKIFADNDIVGPGQLFGRGLIRKRYERVKLIGNDTLAMKLTIRVHRVTKGARAQVEQAGGKIELIEARGQKAVTKK